MNNIEEKIDTEKEETKEDNIDLIKKKEIKIEDNDKEKNEQTEEQKNNNENNNETPIEEDSTPIVTNLCR